MLVSIAGACVCFSLRSSFFLLIPRWKPLSIISSHMKCQKRRKICGRIVERKCYSFTMRIWKIPFSGAESLVFLLKSKLTLTHLIGNLPSLLRSYIFDVITSRAKPKSAILHVWSSVINTLRAAKSRWIICTSDRNINC